MYFASIKDALRIARASAYRHVAALVLDLIQAALPADHPLASRGSLELGELSDISFLGYAGAESDSANQFMSHLAADAEQVFAMSQEVPTRRTRR